MKVLKYLNLLSKLLCDARFVQTQASGAHKKCDFSLFGRKFEKPLIKNYVAKISGKKSVENEFSEFSFIELIIWVLLVRIRAGHPVKTGAI